MDRRLARPVTRSSVVEQRPDVVGADRLAHHPVAVHDLREQRAQPDDLADNVDRIIVILDGAPMVGADIDEGLASVRAMVAVARSAETGGKLIRLADVTGAV